MGFRGMMRLWDYDEGLEGVYMIQGVGLSSNIYVMAGSSEEIYLIDTGVGNQFNRLRPQLRGEGLDIRDVEGVILTHNHPDHVLGLGEVLEYTTPDIFIHSLDREALDWPSSRGAPIKILEGGELLPILDLKVIHTPGHTPGSICLYRAGEETLFSGDTVFPGGGFGRTDLRGGDPQALIRSLEELSQIRVRNLMPGHMNPIFGGGLENIRKAFKYALAIYRPGRGI